MALSFPNQSRSYDPIRRGVRFWGHDIAMEVIFFITEEALRRIQPDVQLIRTGRGDSVRDFGHSNPGQELLRGGGCSDQLIRPDAASEGTAASQVVAK
jgi:hypothetical protein